MKRVSVIVLQHNNKYLIVQRAEPGKLKDKWEFPGGGIDQGETPEEAGVREYKEETNLDIEIIKPITVIDHKAPKGYVYQFNVFEGRLMSDPKDVILSHEHSNFKWVELSEIQSFDMTNMLEEISVLLK